MPKRLADEFNSQWKKFSEDRLHFSKTDVDSLNSGLNECRVVLNRVRSLLHKYPNVIGSGVSLKFKHGHLLMQPCIVIRVSKKIPNIKEGALPSEIDGCPVDVIETGGMQPRSAFLEPACRLRPGNSISPISGGLGTIGCLVKERLPVYRWKEVYRTLPQSDFLILSCNHVIADYNRAIPGDTLIHPGIRGSGTLCAYFLRQVPLVAFPDVNEIDAAVAKPLIPVSPNRQGLGVPQKLGRAKVGDEVFMTGATSGHTQGTVTDIDAFVRGEFGPLGRADFVHSIATTNMADRGDSGSVIVKKDPNVGGSQLVAVGMLYAGDDFEKIPPPLLPQDYFCHLDKVLDMLNIDLIVNTSHPFIEWD